MAEGKTWTFEQLAGKRSIIELSGWSAPFGRPRQGAMAETSIKLRQEVIHYPGSNVPTRHIFGHAFEPIELHGRLRDRALGSGGALQKKRQMLAFFADKQPVQMSWGDAMSVSGIITDLTFGLEAEREITWKLVFDVDRDEAVDDRALAVPPVPRDPNLAALEIELAFDELNASIAAPFGLPGSITDVLGTAVDVAAGLVGQLTALSDQVASFKDATFAELNRFASLPKQLRQAVNQIRDTFTSLPADQTALGANADGAIDFLTAQVSVESQAQKIFDALSDTEDAAEQTKLGKIQTTYIARDGDTWEGISATFFGSPNRANDIRDANSIGPGMAPAPGVEYIIPQ